MTIIATVPMPASNRLDLSTTHTLLPVPVPARAVCPTWCTTGPHQAYPADHADDGGRDHIAAPAVLHVDGDLVDEPVTVTVAAQWCQAIGPFPLDKPTVGVHTENGDRNDGVALWLSPDDAEELALVLLAAARKLRDLPGGAR